MLVNVTRPLDCVVVYTRLGGALGGGVETAMLLTMMLGLASSSKTPGRAG
jgi:hypothetical protein